MLRAMTAKELRETAGIALLALLAYAYVVAGYVGWNMPVQIGYRTLVPFASDDFAAGFTQVAVLFCLALGFRKSVAESVRGTWLFLFHRPMDRRRIVAVKLATALVTELVGGLFRGERANEDYVVRNDGTPLIQSQSPGHYANNTFRTLEGAAYFVGYDSESKLCVGYLGTQGYRPHLPPPEEWFAMDGRLVQASALQGGVSYEDRLRGFSPSGIEGLGEEPMGWSIGNVWAVRLPNKRSGRAERHANHRARSAPEPAARVHGPGRACTDGLQILRAGRRDRVCRPPVAGPRSDRGAAGRLRRVGQGPFPPCPRAPSVGLE